MKIELEELTNDDESCYYVKDFTVDPEIDGKKIICDVFIKTLNMEALTEWDDENPFLSELYIVPKPEFITQKNINSVIEFSGFDESFLNEDSKFFQLDVISYGLGIRVTGGMKSFSTQKEALEAMKKEVMALSLIGFYLDKSWNMIGTTGWDSLNQLVSNEDALKATINRMDDKN